MNKKLLEHNWYAILGTMCGIVSVHPDKKEAYNARKKLGYGKENRIVPCTITINDKLT